MSSAPAQYLYSSDFELSGLTDSQRLQAAFNALNEKGTLYIDRDYELDQTVNIKQRRITVLGRGGTIKRASGASSTLVLFLIDNTTHQIVNNIVIDGLSFTNPTPSPGTGAGTAIQLQQDANSYLYHIRLQNISINNFDVAIKIVDSFDIVIDNCEIETCNIAIKTEFSNDGVGQIKLFGGYYINNNYGVHIDNPSGSYAVYQGQIMAFGTTFGHRRPGSSTSIAVYVAKPIGGVFLYGCHIEDMNNVIYFADNFPNNTANEPMVVSLFGSSVFNISGDYVIDTRNAEPYMGGVSIVGNYNWRSAGTPELSAIPKIESNGRGSVISAGNSLSSYPNISNMSYTESSSPILPLPSFVSNNRPSAGSVPKGYTIYNESTNKINVSDGSSNWYNADGTTA